MNRRKNVLFLCSGNACRSPMAEALFNELEKDGVYHATSAGLSPQREVHPLAIKAMGEVGIDISRHTPRAVKNLLGRAVVSYLIVVCEQAEQNCPKIWPGVAEEHRYYWRLKDPSTAAGSPEQVMVEFRNVRNEIERLIKNWLDEQTSADVAK